MALKSAEAVILFDFFMILLLSSYGAGVTGISFNALNSLGQPPVSQFPSINCNGLCSPFSTLITATAYVGWAIVNLPVLLAYIIVVAITYMNIVLVVSFSQGLQSNGVPIIGFFFLALQMIVFLEVVRIFRGSATGL